MMKTKVVTNATGGYIESGVVSYLAYEALVLLTRPQIFLFPPSVREGYALLEKFHVSEFGLGLTFAVLAFLVGIGTVCQMTRPSKAAQLMKVIGLLGSSVVTVFLALVFFRDYPDMLTGALIGLAVAIILASVDNIKRFNNLKRRGDIKKW